MCGITGFVTAESSVGDGELRAIVQRMSAAISYRGPDSSGEWTDAAAGVALGHRRLAIVGLGPDGHQPMLSHSGRYVISFNGEIYNYRDLQGQLEADATIHWRGTSDTEVMLAGIERWGFEETLRRSTGMFALALWDRRERRLYLARDRLGEKPLYYGFIKGSLVFASELWALRRFPDCPTHPEPGAVQAYLHHGYVPAPLSILPGIHKMQPGSWVGFERRDQRVCAMGVPQAYWSVAHSARTGLANRFDGGEEEAVSELRNLLSTAVRRQMVADVPLGAFLSGGIDSSLIVSLMQESTSRPVKTFSVGFNDREFDESAYAGAVARHLGTDHTEIRLTENDALQLVPKMPRLSDEPFSDSSLIPSTLISQVTRRSVTVALTGDGGDELFWGYQRYQLFAKLSRAPAKPRAMLGQALSLTPLLGALESRASRITDRLRKLSDVLQARSEAELYRSLMTIVPGAAPDADVLARSWNELAGAPDFERMMYVDQLTYLPGDVLAKVDRASMSASLETRVPLLDHQVVEFAWRVPAHLKWRDGVGKWLMRQLLYKYVPRHLLDRPKAGFAVPMEYWLRGPLREWLMTYLSAEAVRRTGLLNEAQVQRLLTEHMSGKRRWHQQLWALAMLQAWTMEFAAC